MDRRSTLPSYPLILLAAAIAVLLSFSPGSPLGGASVAGSSGQESYFAAPGDKPSKPTPTEVTTPAVAATWTPGKAATSTPTATLALVPTEGASPTSVVPSPSASPTATGTATATFTPTPTGTATATFTPTPAGTATATFTSTPTATSSALKGTVSNDDVGDAPLISYFPFTTAEDTTDATVAGDDPNMGAGQGRNSNTVWWRLVAPSNGTIRANTFGSGYDTVLAAFTGSRGNLSVVASNDDSGGTYQSQITFNAQAGTTYYLEAARYGSSSGGGTLQLTVEFGDFPLATSTPTYTPFNTATPSPTVASGPSPSNDDIDSAISFSSLPFTDSEDTTGATMAQDDPVMGSSLGVNSHTVWYKFVAPFSGSVRADTFGSGYDTVLAAFTGSRGNLSLVASNDDSGGTYQSQITFNAQAGTTYYLEVAQLSSVVAANGGHLQLTVAAAGAATSGPSVTPVQGTLVALLLGSSTPATPPTGRPAGSATRDARYFSQTGYRVSLDAFWDFFQKRGGVRTFGYPVSWEFPMMGFQVQFFQRAIMQLMPDGSVAVMNLLDEGLMPYSHINFSSFPVPDLELIQSAPSPSDPNYGGEVMAFLRANVPDQWNGLPVNFLQAFMATVRYEDAFPQGGGDPALVPLLSLELLGLPTSKPAYDPANHNFVYQRFQRGILHYDATTGATQGLLLADYLKSIMTGEGLPPDLDQEARGSRFYRQYDRTQPDYLSRPGELPGTNLSGAFDPGPTVPAVASAQVGDPALLAVAVVLVCILGLSTALRRGGRNGQGKM